MAKPSFLLGLTAVLLSLVSTSFGQETPPPEAKKITDLFTLQPGGKNGGCDDDRIKVLDQWVSESTKSVKVALDALQDWLWDDRVTDAMNVFFGIESYTDFVGADDIVEYIAGKSPSPRFLSQKLSPSFPISELGAKVKNNELI